MAMRTDDRAGGASRALELAAGGGATAGLSDEQLLGRFAASRDEAAELAFAALVHRHGPMVRGICRRALRDPADESDAFQATFLVLARRAGSIRMPAGSLAPWLHGVGVRVARRARIVAARRATRERTNFAVAPEVAARDDRPPVDETRAVIDEELARLPGRYASALVLFYLEGLSQEEAADRLGCPVGTVRSRLSRGRDLLRDRLARRGLAPQAAPALAAFVASPAAFDRISDSTARLAARLAAGRTAGGMVPPAVASLASGVARMMTLRKLAPIATLSAACVVGALGLVAASAQTPKADPPPPAAKPAAPKPEIVESSGVEAGMDPGAFLDWPAFVVKTEPPTGSVDVDPKLAEIRVTFSREMADESWSWVTLNKDAFPEIVGKIRYDKDRRTCVAPVKLEPGKLYAVSFNSQKFVNFRDTKGAPAVPYMLVFKTKK